MQLVINTTTDAQNVKATGTALDFHTYRQAFGSFLVVRQKKLTTVHTDAIELDLVWKADNHSPPLKS